VRPAAEALFTLSVDRRAPFSYSESVRRRGMTWDSTVADARTRGMRVPAAAAALICASAASAAVAALPPRHISTSGVRVVVPAGWHAFVSTTPRCDPERLLIASSTPIHFSGARLEPPARGNVVLLLLEDRYVQDRPSGDLRRPAHFSVAWNRLVHLKTFCGLPNARAVMRYFTSHGRYLGFIVYPGTHVGSTVRAKTLALMDSLRVST